MKKLLIIFLSFTFIFLFFNLKAEEVIFRYNVKDLPTTTDYLNIEKEGPLDIGEVEFNYIEKSDTFDIIIKYKNKNYKINNKLPAQDRIGNITKGFYFSRKINNIIFKFIYFEFESRNDLIQKNSFFNNTLNYNLKLNILNPFQNKVEWNITTGKYKLIDKLEIYATPVYEKDEKLYYLDFVINQDVDKILAVNLEFNYRTNYWFSSSDTKTKQVLYLYETYFVKGEDYLPYMDKLDKALDYQNKYLNDINNIVSNLGNIALSTIASPLLGATQAYKYLNNTTIYNAKTIKNSITFKDEAGQRQGMINQKATPTDPNICLKFANTLNDNLGETFKYYVKNKKVVKKGSLLEKYLTRKPTNNGIPIEEIFENSGNKIYSVPLKYDSEEFFYTGTTFDDITFYNVAFQVNGENYVLNQNNINTNYAPNEKITTGDKVKDSFSKFFSAVGKFFVSVWNSYKTILIILLVLVGVVFIGLIILIILKPEILKFIKYLI